LVDDLFQYLQRKLNSLFHTQRQSNIDFDLVKNGEEIEIRQPRLYDGFLFRLRVNGKRLAVTRSEHYVDDVNVLTLESILDGLFVDYLGATAPQL
jgi:hypothetical protein